MSAALPRNLPRAGEVTLDHIGHFVADADAATEALSAAGFTVTPYSAQVVPDPATGRSTLTGTANVCVMLRTGYVEVLTHTADTPIGLEFREALARRPGLHLSAFAVADAEAAHARLAAEWPMRPLARFSRMVGTEDGEREARFTVARLQKGTMAEGRVQVLTHHDEAAMWQPRWLGHENTAVGLASLIVAAPDPAEAASRYGLLLDRPVTPFGDGLAVALDRGRVEFVDVAAGEQLAGRAVEPDGPAFVGYRLAATDLRLAEECLDRAGLAPRTDEGRLVCAFPPALGLGAWIFEPA